jgi:hypothetical protein
MKFTNNTQKKEAIDQILKDFEIKAKQRRRERDSIISECLDVLTLKQIEKIKKTPEEL